MKKLLLLALIPLAADAAVVAKLASPTPASLSDGQTITVTVPAPATITQRVRDASGKTTTVQVPACIDFGLYVNEGTLGAGNSNVDIRANDFYVTNVFQGGADDGKTSVAHLYTGYRSVTITAHGNKGTFHIVTQTFPCSQLARMARGQKKS